MGDGVEFYQKPATEGLPGWHGPAEILGQESSTVFARFGGSVLRVHPLHVRHIDARSDGEEAAADVSEGEGDMDDVPEFEELTTDEEEFCSKMADLKGGEEDAGLSSHGSLCSSMWNQVFLYI